MQDSASSASLVALLAALHRAGGGEVAKQGATRRYTMYVSSQTHSSLEKAARVAGLGAAGVTGGGGRSPYPGHSPDKVLI
ncbi:hypothetical protein [Nonomuraea basaltis]|uniref:hypothetical protein n=1 Tax=Nonomuraea basaltis TaxID=2495887 RepID=UPI003B84512E